MKTYLVGGAVRDQLLGCSAYDEDFVVVGATIEQMLAQGYKPVGKDFPVFLHPETHQQFALARTEKKAGVGYKGFTVFASPDVTLEEDLRRRDLTINAMAKEGDHIIDPFGGQVDIKAKLLRHVSPAFSEDPLRVLRVARFAARFASLGFRVADETMELMSAMSQSGELETLTAERVWNEVDRALQEPSPQVFIEVLRQCGALSTVLPAVDALFGVPQPEKYHPEIDTGVHTLMVLEQAAKLSPDPEVRFAALVHDLGKGVTPEEQWPSHRGHELGGLPLLKQMMQQLPLPKAYVKLAEKVMQYHLHVHRAFELRPKTLVELFENIGAYKQPKHLDQFLLACEADAKGRKGFEHNDYPQGQWLRAARDESQQIDVQAILDSGKVGVEVKRAIQQERIQKMKNFKDRHGAA